MKDCIFISDLHLAAERPQIIKLFVDFTNEVAAGADALYILGDFLEYWLGDDDPTPALTPVFDSLIQLAEKHQTRIFFMHGNRDFLVGQQLAQRCHFEIIDDLYKIKLQGQDAVLMHGDTLCTDDIEYQKFRQVVRSGAWKQDILSKTLEQRIQIARNLREQSQQSTADKQEAIMDVNQDATDRVFIDNNVRLLIHGHTHRPAIHHKKVNAMDTTRIVLGDWFEHGSYLRINNTSDFKLQSYL